MQCGTYTAFSASEEEDTSRKALDIITHPSNDIGRFYKDLCSFPDAKKHSVICNLWKPEVSYSFPANASGRKFQHHWLSQFRWLVYSRLLDSAFCVNCVAFATTTLSLSNLVNALLTNWNNALERLKIHITSPIHQTASLRAAQYQAYIADNSKAIDVQLDSIVSKQVRLNREKLIPIVEAIILWGRQNIALRGSP